LLVDSVCPLGLPTHFAGLVFSSLLLPLSLKLRLKVSRLEDASLLPDTLLVDLRLRTHGLADLSVANR
jgi:hypothetical protein